ESRGRWKDALPSVASLYDSIRVRRAGERSTIEFTVDRQLAANSQRVVQELLTAALGGFGIRVNPPGAEPPAEQIDREPVVVLPAVALAALPAYDPQAQFAEEVDQVQGPFGVRIGELRLGADATAGLEIAVEGFAGELPNVGASEDRVRLFVDSVKSTGGQELLRPEAGGRERNSQPAAFKSAGGKRLRATKAVRLIPGADPKALQSLTGHVQLRLPTRTEVVTLAHPAAGATAERQGAVFTVTAIAPGQVSYQIAGAKGRLLLFRALNARGEPLPPPGPGGGRAGPPSSVPSTRAGSRSPRRARSPPTSCSARVSPASASTRGRSIAWRSCSRPRRRPSSCRSRSPTSLRPARRAGSRSTGHRPSGPTAPRCSSASSRGPAVPARSSPSSSRSIGCSRSSRCGSTSRCGARPRPTSSAASRAPIF